MKTNMNILDRRLRALVVAPLVVLVGIVIGPSAVGSIILYAVAAIMLATSTAGYCPLYSVLHLGGSGGKPQPR